MIQSAAQARRKSGLTLMEIIVAVGLIATITLLVIGTLARLLSTGGKTAHQTAAGLLAQELLETSAQAGPPNWGFSSSNIESWTGERRLLLPGDQSTTPFQYRLEVLQLRKSPEDLGTLAQLTVRVRWWDNKPVDPAAPLEPDQPTWRVGQGRTDVEASRTVYVRN